MPHIIITAAHIPNRTQSDDIVKWVKIVWACGYIIVACCYRDILICHEDVNEQLWNY